MLCSIKNREEGKNRRNSNNKFKNQLPKLLTDDEIVEN